MNWLAIGIWLTAVGATAWLADLMEYSNWVYPEHHLSQRRRIIIGGIGLLIISTLFIGRIFK